MELHLMLKQLPQISYRNKLQQLLLLCTSLNT